MYFFHRSLCKSFWRRSFAGITNPIIIVINAEKIKVKGGNKLEEKKYYSHSGYIGNMKVTDLETMLEKKPEFVIRHAVRGMIPHNILGRRILKKLILSN